MVFYYFKVKDGIVFYQSSNGVILTEGIPSVGIIPPNYFLKITSIIT